MTHLIDKNTLISEIERHQRKLCILSQSNEVELRKNATIQNGAYCSLLSFIKTLEVKEVDLEEEMKSWRHNHFNGKRDKEAVGEYLERVSQLDLAKHFFELGLKTMKGE